MDADEFQKILSAIDGTIAKTNVLKKASGALSQASESDFEAKLDEYLLSLGQLQALTNELADDVMDEPIPEDLLSLVSEGKRPDEYNPKLKQELEDLKTRASGRAEEFQQAGNDLSASLQNQ